MISIMGRRRKLGEIGDWLEVALGDWGGPRFVATLRLGVRVREEECEADAIFGWSDFGENEKKKKKRSEKYEIKWM